MEARLCSGPRQPLHVRARHVCSQLFSASTPLAADLSPWPERFRPAGPCQLLSDWAVDAELITGRVACRIDVITSTDEEDWVAPEVVSENSHVDDGQNSGRAKLLGLIAAVGGLALVIVGGVVFKDQIAAFLTYFTGIVDDLGPAGYVLYFFVYAALEVLAVPAIPLTMASGAIFGIGPGSILVSLSAASAAAVSFLIARYLARDKVTLFFNDWMHRRVKSWIALNNFRFAVFELGSAEQAVSSHQHCHREGWLQSGGPTAPITITAAGSVQLSLWTDQCSTFCLLLWLLSWNVPWHACVRQRGSCGQSCIHWRWRGVVTDLVANCARIRINRGSDCVHRLTGDRSIERGGR